MLPWLLRLSGAPTVNLSRFSWSGGATVILSRFPWSGGLAANLSIFPWSAIPDGCFKVFSRGALARALRALTGRFPSRRGLGLMLGLLRPSGAYFGLHWADFWRPGASLGSFKASCRLLGPLLGRAWAPFSPLGGSRGRLAASWAFPGALLGPI